MRASKPPSSADGSSTTAEGSALPFLMDDSLTTSISGRCKLEDPAPPITLRIATTRPRCTAGAITCVPRWVRCRA